MTGYLEVVSVSREDEMSSVDTAIASGVDWVLGGKFVRDAMDRLTGTGVRFALFPGTVVGHPNQLRGSLEEIVAGAVEITATEGVTEVDLLARHRHGIGHHRPTDRRSRGADPPVQAGQSLGHQVTDAGDQPAQSHPRQRRPGSA
jgi:hypothetical protein